MALRATEPTLVSVGAKRAPGRASLVASEVRAATGYRSGDRTPAILMITTRRGQRIVRGMRSRGVLAVLTVLALTGCTQARPVSGPAPAPSAVSAVVGVTPTQSSSPYPTASVLATRAARPAPTTPPTPKRAPTPRATHKAPITVRRPSGCGVTQVCCIASAPCKLPPITSTVWKKTIGCTVAWRKAMHRTTCPPGWPPIP